MAWLVTRGLWGDLRRDVTEQDVHAAEEMAASVTRRLVRAQPFTTRLGALASCASLRSPWSTELPNAWPRVRVKPPRKRARRGAGLRGWVGDAARRRRGRRRTAGAPAAARGAAVREWIGDANRRRSSRSPGAPAAARSRVRLVTRGAAAAALAALAAAGAAAAPRRVAAAARRRPRLFAVGAAGLAAVVLLTATALAVLGTSTRPRSDVTVPRTAGAAAALPERLAPDRIGDIVMQREHVVEEAYAQAGSSSIVAEGRVLSVRRGDDVEGSFQVAALKPGISAADEDVRRAVVKSIGRGQFRLTRDR